MSCKSDALDAIIYPALQARSQRCDLGIFNKGIVNVAAGQAPSRLDFTSGTPKVLSGIGTTHFFSFTGNKWRRASGCVGCGGLGAPWRHAFRNLFQAKTAAIEITPAQPIVIGA